MAPPPPLAPVLTYLNNIPSILDSNPGLPAMLDTINLTASIEAGDAIQAQNLVDAKYVAKALGSMHDLSSDNRITAAVASSAEVRASPVEAAHVFAAYTPANIVHILQGINNRLDAGFNQVNDRFNEVNDRIDQAIAMSRNVQVLSHNHNHVPHLYRPLYKNLPGHGLALVVNLYGNVPNLQGFLVAPAQPPVVGTLPPGFSTNFTAYTRTDLIHLIIFYNDDFGIIAGDTVPASTDKLHIYLTTF